MASLAVILSEAKDLGRLRDSSPAAQNDSSGSYSMGRKLVLPPQPSLTQQGKYFFSKVGQFLKVIVPEESYPFDADP